jgi:hypothetical protein
MSWIIWTAILLIAAVYLAWRLLFLFEGERFFRDVLHEWRLSRKSLAQLDAEWAASPAKSDTIISLTTIPSRISRIDYALKGLLAQSRPPKKIVVNIPDHSLREDCAYEVPPHLAALQGVEVHRCGRDWGPATKLIPTLLSADDPDQPILVVDDDRIYPRDTLEEIEKHASRLPDAALTNAGWIVPGDLTDGPTRVMDNLLKRAPAPLRGHRLRQPEEVDVLLGVFAYLVRPRFFDLEDMTDFSETPRAGFLADDVRTSALCNAPCLVVPNNGLSYLPWQDFKHFKETSLGRINAGDGGPETRNNTIAIRHYADRWRVGGHNLVSSQETV